MSVLGRAVKYVVGAVGVALMIVGGTAALGSDGVPQTPSAVIQVGLSAGLPGQSGSPATSPVDLEGAGLVDRSDWPDVDADGISDDAEELLCGSATCAMPWQDRDGDGVADWVEVDACGSAECTAPTDDVDGDVIPDFVGLVLCGSEGCSADQLMGDVDEDGVESWIEVVICGTATCATGDEDYDSNGVSDAAELAACITDPEAVGGGAGLAQTGADGAWWAVFGAGLVCVGIAVRLFVRESRTPATGRGGEL